MFKETTYQIWSFSNDLQETSDCTLEKESYSLLHTQDYMKYLREHHPERHYTLIALEPKIID